MISREEQSGKNLSKAFLRFPYLYHCIRRTQKACDAGSCHLRPSDVMMLFTIKGEQKKGGGITATQLSESMGIKTPSVNTVLAGLERMGLIRRTMDENDRRFVLITLSNEGESMVKKFRTNYENRIQQLVDYLGVEKSDLLAELMNEIYEYLRSKGGWPPEDVRK
jgi:DNA-binding MarR family transcriptional regulator